MATKPPHPKDTSRAEPPEPTLESLREENTRLRAALVRIQSEDPRSWVGEVAGRALRGDKR